LGQALIAGSHQPAPSKPGCMNVPCCSRCCMPLSVAGIIFCLLIGSLFKSQPFIIDGDEGVEHAADKANALFGAAGIYAATLGLSIFGLLSEKRKQALAQRAGFSGGFSGGSRGGIASAGGGTASVAGGRLSGSSDYVSMELNETNSRQMTVSASLKAEIDEL
jgi:uncharacterized membrane protein YgcG